MFVLAAYAAVYGLGAQITYAINKNYFPKQTPPSDAMWAYVAWIIAGLLLVECISCFLLRKFPRFAVAVMIVAALGAVASLYYDLAQPWASHAH